MGLFFWSPVANCKIMQSSAFWYLSRNRNGLSTSLPQVRNEVGSIMPYDYLLQARG